MTSISEYLPASKPTKPHLLQLPSGDAAHHKRCMQATLQEVEQTNTQQAVQITTLREELHGSLAELDQVPLQPVSLMHSKPGPCIGTCSVAVACSQALELLNPHLGMCITALQ